MKLINDHCDVLGLAVVFGCKTSCVNQGLTQVVDPAVEGGVRMMDHMFQSVGYAVLNVGDDLRSEEIKDAVNVIASTPLPNSYSRFFFYGAAHGYEGALQTSSGDIMLNDIVQPLRDSQNLKSLPLVFVFDSCRTESSEGKFVSIPGPNTILVQATLRHNPALAARCGILTDSLAKVLPFVDKPLLTLLTKDVPDSMKYKLKNSHPDWCLLADDINQLVPSVQCSAIKEINLFKEKTESSK